MSLLAQPSPPVMNGQDLALSVLDRETPLGEFLGAVASQSLFRSTPSAVSRSLRLQPAFTDAYVDEWRRFNEAHGFSVDVDARVEAARLDEDEFRQLYPEDAYPGLAWEPGMTRRRAEAIAREHDAVRIRDRLIAARDADLLDQALAFGAGIVGAAPDPLNYVPIAGQATRAVAVARLGQVGGRAVVGAAEAGLVTAAVQPALAPSLRFFGDDITAEEMLMDVALSAAVGGIFGGAVGAFGARRSRRAQRLIEAAAADPRIRADAARMANIAADQVARDQPIDVGRAPARFIRRVFGAERRAARLDPGMVDPGSGESRVVTARGTEVAVEELVVDADALLTSDRSGYPAGLQPRDRSRVASDVQIATIAGDLDPARLTDSRLASDGAPIVGPDMAVESGNGRVAALRRAYDIEATAERENAARPLVDQAPEDAPGPGDSARRYRAMLERRGYDVSELQQPVLIRRRVTELDDADRQRFAREANERDTAAFSPTERARVDARAMDDGILDLWRGGTPTDPANRAFVRAFERDVVAAGDSGAQRDAGGELSTAGAARVNAAILAKAYDDPDLLAQILEAPDSDIRSIAGALSDAAPAWAQMRAATRDGVVPAAYDLTDALIHAVRLVQDARRKGRPVGERLDQSDLFGGATGDLIERLVRLMHRDRALQQPVSRERLALALDTYARRAVALHEGGPALAALELPTVRPAELLDQARAAQGEIGGAPLAPIDPDPSRAPAPPARDEAPPPATPRSDTAVEAAPEAVERDFLDEIDDIAGMDDPTLEAELARLTAENRLTPEDRAELDGADRELQRVSRIEEAGAAAASCVWNRGP